MTTDRSAAYGNRLTPPITDPMYAAQLALDDYLNDHDRIVTSPTVLNNEQSARFREITSRPGTPLADPPIPWSDDETT